MFRGNIWKEMHDEKDKELTDVKKDARQLLRSNMRKDKRNEEKDRLIKMQAERIEELEQLAKGVQKTGGSIVGRVTQAFNQN